jgi:MFS family permease
MRKANRLAALLICLSVAFGSFADEAVQVTFALRLANNTSSVSILLAAGLAGGILSGPIAPGILHKFGPHKTIPAIFLIQSVLISFASLANEFWSYITVSIALGCTGSLFWVALLIVIPRCAKDDQELDRLNRITHSVRNLGYVGGPAFGGVLYGLSHSSRGLLFLALSIFLAAPVTYLCFKALDLIDENPERFSALKKQHGNFDLSELFRTAGVSRAITPLLMTILLTSVLNVLLIFRVRSELQFSAETYGFVISALSIGLIAGPIAFARFLARFGDAAGASIAAAIIGLGIVWIAMANAMWGVLSAAFLIGAANGIQNALMGSFMMKAIDPLRRVNLMPVYVFCIQSTVFVGFMSAGLIDLAHVSKALLAVGVAAAIIGFGGFAFNINNKPALMLKGVR